MPDVKTIDDIINTALILLPAFGAAMAVAAKMSDKIKKDARAGDHYILLDKRLCGRDIRIYYRPLKYVTLPIKTSYKEQDEPL